MSGKKEKIDLEKEAIRFKIGGVEVIGFPVYRDRKKMEDILKVTQRSRSEAIPKIHNFLSKLEKDLKKRKMRKVDIVTAHDVHAFYEVRKGGYVHVQAYPGFSFPPHAKEDEVCLMASYRAFPRDNSHCFGYLVNQGNYGFEKTGEIAKTIYRNIQKIESKK